MIKDHLNKHQKKETIGRTAIVLILSFSLVALGLEGLAGQASAVFQPGVNNERSLEQPTSGVSTVEVQRAICEDQQYGGREWSEAEKTEACKEYGDLTENSTEQNTRFDREPNYETASTDDLHRAADKERRRQINETLFRIALPATIVLILAGITFVILRKRIPKTGRVRKK